MPERDFTFRPILSPDELGILRRHLNDVSDSALRLLTKNPVVIHPFQFERVIRAFKELSDASLRCVARLSHGVEEAKRAFEDFARSTSVKSSAKLEQPVPTPSPLAAFETNVRSKRDAIFREMFGVTEEHDVWGNKIVEEPASPTSVVPTPATNARTGNGGDIFISGGAGGGTASGGNLVGIYSGDAARAGNMMGTNSVSASNPITPVNELTKNISVTLKNNDK